MVAARHKILGLEAKPRPAKPRRRRRPGALPGAGRAREGVLVRRFADGAGVTRRGLCDVGQGKRHMPPRSGAARRSAGLRRKRQRETMKVYQPALVEARTNIAARQNEGDWQPPAHAPLEHHALPGGQHLSGDPGLPAGRAALVGVHAGVVQA
jgi:hypothetical protein